MTQRNIVPTSVIPLTVEDAREMLHRPLLRLCEKHGPSRLAGAIGMKGAKTLRDARDEKSSLGLHFLANLLAYDETLFDPFLARVGRRSVPTDAVCNTDALPAMTGAVHKLVLAGLTDSDGGTTTTDRELILAEHEIRLAFDALGGLLKRIDLAKAA